MASSLLRTQTSIFRLLNTRSIPEFKPVFNYPVTPHKLQCHQQRLRFSNFFKRGKECKAAAPPPNLIPPSLGLNSLPRFGFVSWYLGMVKSRPVLNKSITCSLIYIATDLSSQTIAMSSLGAYDYLRTLHMAGYGFVLLGPTLHFWFYLMSRYFPGRNLLSTAKKMALGQSVYGPLMTITFFTMNAARKMGLRLLAPRGMQIRELHRWVLKCHACFKVTNEIGRIFCPKCGNGGTLRKDVVTVGENGIVLAAHRQHFSLRGTKVKKKQREVNGPWY